MLGVGWKIMNPQSSNPREAFFQTFLVVHSLPHSVLSALHPQHIHTIYMLGKKEYDYILCFQNLYLCSLQLYQRFVFLVFQSHFIQTYSSSTITKVFSLSTTLVLYYDYSCKAVDVSYVTCAMGDRFLPIPLYSQTPFLSTIYSSIKPFE